MKPGDFLYDHDKRTRGRVLTIVGGGEATEHGVRRVEAVDDEGRAFYIARRRILPAGPVRWKGFSLIPNEQAAYSDLLC